MVSPAIIRHQMEMITADLVGLGLCDHQNFPSLKSYRDEVCEVGVGEAENLSVALRDISYHDVYRELAKGHAYNIKMLDGALVHMQYRFRRGDVEAHRLAFFPSPNLEEFQNNPDVYIEDEVYAEVVKKNIVPFPMRFDFDRREEVVEDVEHPMSHLTLGQYSNCRIPVSSPLTPFEFVSFVLRNFYNTAYKKYCGGITVFEDAFEITITGSESSLVHVYVPK